MISTRSVGMLIDTVVCLTLSKWETVSGRFGGYMTGEGGNHGCEGDFGKEVCCEAERRGTRTAPMLYRMSPQMGHSARPDHYRNARLVPSPDGTCLWAASSDLTFSRSRSVTSRRNREFSSWSSTIRSSAPRVRSGSLASGVVATNAG